MLKRVFIKNKIGLAFFGMATFFVSYAQADMPKKEMDKSPHHYLVNHVLRLNFGDDVKVKELVNDIYEDKPEAFQGLCYASGKRVVCQDVLESNESYCQFVPELASKHIAPQEAMENELALGMQDVYGLVESAPTLTSALTKNGQPMLTLRLKSARFSRVWNLNCYSEANQKKLKMAEVLEIIGPELQFHGILE